LSLPGKRVHWSIVILVTFDMETGNLDRKAIEDVDDTALHIAFQGQTMVGICPGAVHGEVDVFDETLIVRAEQRFNGRWLELGRERR
jgi:hypothetical protein